MTIKRTKMSQRNFLENKRESLDFKTKNNVNKEKIEDKTEENNKQAAAPNPTMKNG